MSALNITDVRFRYAKHLPEVLHIPEFSMADREKVFLFGPSGSGKSTLLSLIGGLAAPGSGNVKVLGKDLGSLSGSARDRFRGENIGFIFQVFNLVPYLSVMDNVTLPTRFGRGISQGFSSVEDEARYLLAKLGIESLVSTSVTKLSIGQQQRVAAARALLGSPGIIIADEPTSALDADARAAFLDVLFGQVERDGSSLLFVSHDRSLASRFDREVALLDLNRVIPVIPAGGAG